MQAGVTCTNFSTYTAWKWQLEKKNHVVLRLPLSSCVVREACTRYTSLHNTYWQHVEIGTVYHLPPGSWAHAHARCPLSIPLHRPDPSGAGLKWPQYCDPPVYGDWSWRIAATLVCWWSLLSTLQSLSSWVCTSVCVCVCVCACVCVYICGVCAYMCAYVERVEILCSYLVHSHVWEAVKGFGWSLNTIVPSLPKYSFLL